MMRTKLGKILLPTALGFMAVLGVLIAINVVFKGGTVFTESDNGFFMYFVAPAFVIAALIQYNLTLPYWKKFIISKKIFGLGMVEFVGLLSIVSGLIFGLVFWERDYGFTEFILVSLTGIVAFAIYWTVNVTTLKQLESL